MAGGYVIRHQSALQTVSVADHVSATKRLHMSPTTYNEELEEPALNDSHASTTVVSEMTYTVSSGTLNSSIPYHTTTEQVLQLLAAVAQASETVIPVHAIEDNGMNFQM